MPPDQKSQTALENENLAIYESYKASPFLSIKHTSYFHVYEKLLTPFVGREIVFVEVGIYNGGSLFMWRDFFGPSARIIGIDLNPSAKRWEEHGFEIWIGNQADPKFWQEFHEAVPVVDVFVDDGGHSNLQQIQTVVSVVPHVRDGGLVIVEDTHTSYMSQFGNPSRRSFMRFAFDVADSINGRFPGIRASSNPLSEHVSSISLFESIVAFHVDRPECFVSQPTTNFGQSVDATDYRHAETSGRLIGGLRDRLVTRFGEMPTNSFLRRLGAGVFSTVLFVQNRMVDRRTRKFFGN